MSRRKLLRRIVLSVVTVVVVVTAMVAVLVVSTVRQSFPQTSGEIAIDGMSAPVTVIRDELGIPNIYADTSADLFRAQGFVDAQDRFFLMDFRRKVTAGRVSELVGSGGVEADKFVRTMGWRQVAEQEFPKLAPETRQYLQAYADGVNAYLRTKTSPDQISLEYTLLLRKAPDYRIEDWTPIDSLAWLKAMAWDLRSDYSDELTRAQLTSRLSVKQIQQLYPPYPVDTHAPILSDADWSPTKRAVTGPTGGAASTAAASTPAATTAGTTTPAASTPAATTAGTTTAGTSATAVPAVVTEGQAAYAQAAHNLLNAPHPLGSGEGIGSNSWVVSGAHTTTGKPLLANDPHLSTSIPGIWSQMGLHCRTVSSACPFDVAGFSFAGLPGIVIGHNQRVAWGFTNLAPDVSDFYLEQVDGSTYLRDGQQVPLTLRNETIKVAGGPTQTIVVRSTVHGPIISDVSAAAKDAGTKPLVRGAQQSNSYAVSLAWTGLRPSTTADAIFMLNKAQNWVDFRAAASKFAVPSQNLIYADVDGHIGYQAPGMVPVRRAATAGSPPGYWPTPGWQSEWDWQGFVPFDQMPYSYDPPEGYIVTANQMVSASPTPFLTTEWDYGFRAQRIRNLIESTPKISPERMAQIQLDNRNEFAPVLSKALLAIKVDDFTAQAQRLLKDWDYTQPADKSRASSSAAYYNAVWRELLSSTFDELPAELAPDGGGRWMTVIQQLLADPKNAFWDDKTTPGVTEGAEEILRRSMVRARLNLASHTGKDPATWRWGRMHQLELKHPVMGDPSVPGLIQDVFNRSELEMPGGSSIVNAFGWNAAKGYDVVTGPSMRMVIDLGSLDASRWVNETGQSGHAFNRHYDDQVKAWANGDTFGWPFSQAAVSANAADTLTLTPSSR